MGYADCKFPHAYPPYCGHVRLPDRIHNREHLISQEKLRLALATTEQVCREDSTALLEQSISQVSLPDLPILYSRYTHSAIKHNAVAVLRSLAARGVDITPRFPTFIRDANVHIDTLQLLLDTGWDINSTAHTTHDATHTLPFLWHVLDRRPLVEWGLAHGAHTAVHFSDATPPARRMLHETLLEKCAARHPVATYELLRSHGAPHGRRELHFAVERSTHGRARYGAFDDAEGDERAYRERLRMVRHLLDVVGLDANAPDQPPEMETLPLHCGGGGRSAGPICYIPSSFMLGRDTREVTWVLLERGADPGVAMEFAWRYYPRFVEDVDAWRARGRKRGRGRWCV